MQPIGVGVIGLGFMGRTHIGAYAAASGNRLVAVADASADRLSGRAEQAGNLASPASQQVFDPAQVKTYQKSQDLLRDSEVELVSICTPTDTHSPLAVAALEAGKHVLVEKPLATTVEEIRRVAGAAKAAGRLVMPAMCMRFWPGWTWLKDRIDDKSLGRLLGITFTRMGSAPTWSPEFYRNDDRSGGALFDLHIHDADFVSYCFGVPDSVCSQGTTHHLTTMYHYRDGRGPQRVVAEGGWGAAAGFPFRMRYTAQFENATADWDLSRDPVLLVSHEGRCEPEPLPAEGAYQSQVRHMLEAVTAFRANRSFRLRATIGDAEAVTRLLNAERQSLARGGTIAVQ
jgi:predicted dehydrogenase